MAVPYTPDPHNKQLLPLGVDPSNSRPITLDLDLYPHLFVAGQAGSGITSTLRLIAAHALSTGSLIHIVDPSTASFPAWEDLDGATLAADPDDIVEEIAAFHGLMQARFRMGQKARRRLLVIDGLPVLTHVARREGHTQLAAALRLLESVVREGRAVGCHLVADLSPDVLTQLPGLRPQIAVGATSLLLGKYRPDFVRQLGIDPRQQRTYRGAGVLRTPGTDGRPIALAYLTEDQAHAVAGRPQATA